MHQFMWFSAKIKEAAEGEKALTAASLANTAATAAACLCGCVRARWGGAELGARVGTERGGGSPEGGRARARGCLAGRGRCAPTPRTACPRVLSAAVRLEQPPKSAWRHFEAERRRNGRAGCGRGGGGGGDWMRRRRRIPESSGVRGVASRKPGGRKQFS